MNFEYIEYGKIIQQTFRDGVIYHLTIESERVSELRLFGAKMLRPLCISEARIASASKYFGLPLSEYEVEFHAEAEFRGMVAVFKRKSPTAYELAFTDGTIILMDGCMALSSSAVHSKAAELTVINFPNLSRPKGEVSLRTTSEGYYVLRIRYEGYTVYATDSDRYLYSHEIIETYPDVLKGVLRGRNEGDWVETPY